jgi:hypothetical protein
MDYLGRAQAGGFRTRNNFEEPQTPTDSGALRRFGVTALWRCDLARSPPALERRLIAFPQAQDRAL